MARPGKRVCAEGVAFQRDMDRSGDKRVGDREEVFCGRGHHFGVGTRWAWERAWSRRVWEVMSWSAAVFSGGLGRWVGAPSGVEGGDDEIGGGGYS